MISLFLILAYQRVRILEWRAIFFGNFFLFFLGFFSRFLVEGRCEEGRKEGMGEGSKKNK